MIEQLQDILLELGVKLLKWRSEGATEGEWQGTQLKAEADVRSHDFVSAALSTAWPDIPILSEEDLTSLTNDRPAEYWLIDPIDGTASFCSGFDGFVTQAALMRDAEPVLGMVHAPALGLTFAATKGGAATCNGQSLVVGGRAAVNPVLIDNYPEPHGIARSLYLGLPCSAYVESGSLGLKICRIADGTADLFVKDVVVRDWDLAPAHLILECVGGTLTTLSGAQIPYAGVFERAGIIAAANPQLAAHVHNWLNRHLPDAP